MKANIMHLPPPSECWWTKPKKTTVQPLDLSIGKEVQYIIDMKKDYEAWAKAEMDKWNQFLKQE
jgi:hypothetical protein